ncbi:esterase E4-like [Anoplophora glabripennis]|uniref:esterase E4-like n=1 Tax=Anoplophora glabripennis TaxID=217634 RepID=UPI0008740ED4|nr:esterase E4-like [Anoplophora glabripennis]
MFRHVALIVFLGHALAFSEANERDRRSMIINPIVTTPLGKIKGIFKMSRLGYPISVFRGIRYAKAPVNELRFKPPEPVDKWEGVYDATEDGPVCPQLTTESVSEDCLILNVYSIKLPEGTENSKRSVIVYIHGGGFYSGGSYSYWVGPNYLVDQDIVLVTISYRLGTLGFLSTGDKEAPGNNGLKDQVQALKWVKQNIESFGGDPDCVTIMGYGAGAMSVILHMVSPMSQNLFHKAVAMSGSPLGNWPIPHNQLDLAKKQAKFVGCPYDTTANIVKCLKTKPFDELSESLHKFKEFANDPVMIWSAVIEPDFGQPRFLTDHPIYLIQNDQFKRVPFMTGLTADEFGYRAFTVINNETLTKQINNEWEKTAPIAFLYERDTDTSKSISKELKTFYLQDEPVDRSQLTPLAQLYADSVTGFGVNRAAKLIAEHSNASVYYYRFSYQGRYSHFYTPRSNNKIIYGVVHEDDFFYLIYVSSPFIGSPPTEVQMVSKLTALYANFAKTGNPIPAPSKQLDNVKWEPFTLKDQKYMDIGKKLLMQEKLYEKRYAVWEKLFPLDQYSKNKQSG